jgi:hypothetical protein
MSDETPTIEDIKEMSAEEIRALKNKAAKRLLTRVILPKIGISIAIAVVSHLIANAINDKLDDILDKDDDNEDENED